MDAMRHWLEAAGTTNLHLGRKAAYQPDIFDDLPGAPVFAQKLRAPRGFQRRFLLDSLDQVNDSGREVLIKYNFPERKILYF
jgi:hypothetical protein